jgi:hypothetical protein
MPDTVVPAATVADDFACARAALQVFIDLRNNAVANQLPPFQLIYQGFRAQHLATQKQATILHNYKQVHDALQGIVRDCDQPIMEEYRNKPAVRWRYIERAKQDLEYQKERLANTLRATVQSGLDQAGRSNLEKIIRTLDRDVVPTIDRACKGENAAALRETHMQLHPLLQRYLSDFCTNVSRIIQDHLELDDLIGQMKEVRKAAAGTIIFDQFERIDDGIAALSRLSSELIQRNLRHERWQDHDGTVFNIENDLVDGLADIGAVRTQWRNCWEFLQSPETQVEFDRGRRADCELLDYAGQVTTVLDNDTATYGTLADPFGRYRDRQFTWFVKVDGQLLQYGERLQKILI